MNKIQKISLLLFLFGVGITACVSDPFLPGGGQGRPDEPCPPDLISFVNEIQPLVVSSCAFSGCHDAITAADDIILDTYENIMKEVKKGDPNNSGLYEELRAEPDDIMPEPPYAPLSDAQVQLIYDWIMQDAPNIVCAEPCDTTVATYTSVILPIMQNQCIGCHNNVRADGNVNLSTYQEIHNYAMNGQLLGTIEHQAGFIAMPPSLIKMSQCDIDNINIWIRRGALED